MRKSFKIQSGIYRITNRTTGKTYVGYSTCIPFRWYKHRENLQRQMHSNCFLQKDWNKWGSSTFEFSLLEYVPYLPDMLVKEKQWIRRYKDIGEVYNIVM